MDRIIGQDKAVGVLQASLGTGRLHHAYIFHGPAGVGKFTTARDFARILLCHNPQTTMAGGVSACGQCQSCKLMNTAPSITRVTAPGKAARNKQDEPDEEEDEAQFALSQPHPDFHVVTKELARFSDEKTIRDRKLMTIPVEVLGSALLEPVHRMSRLGHNKVFIVDEAELVTAIGQNKLLKTLEEPPAGTFIILITSSEDRLLATIRSRCQRVAFVPLPDTTVEAWLKTNEPELNKEDRAYLVRFAGGSLGRASMAAHYKLQGWAGVVLPAIKQMTTGKYPVELGGQIAKLIDEFAHAWVDSHDGASKEAANKLGASLMWTLITQEARARIAELSKGLNPDDPVAAEDALAPWLGVIDALGVVEPELASNVNMGLVADHLVSLMHRALTDRRVSLAASL